MRHPISVLALTLLLTAACGAFSVVDSEPGGGDAGSSDAGQDAGPSDAGPDGGGPDGGGDGGPVDCAGRDFCACWQDPACRFVSESCLCPCDYMCPGEEPCDCGCGGGAYLGCVDATCPRVNCAVGEVLERDAEGCGVCVPSTDCADLGYCDCEAVARCSSVTNIGHCGCGYGCDPTGPICDCVAPPYEPTWVGCVDLGCPDAGCDTSIEMFVIGADGCAACAPRPDLP